MDKLIRVEDPQKALNPLQGNVLLVVVGKAMRHRATARLKLVVIGRRVLREHPEFAPWSAVFRPADRRDEARVNPALHGHRAYHHTFLCPGHTNTPAGAVQWTSRQPTLSLRRTVPLTGSITNATRLE